MHPRTETLLYQAARAQIVEQVIKPRLAKGEIVISDRYYDSTIAYQGYGHQQDLEQVRGLIRYASLNGIESGQKLKVTARLVGYCGILLLLGAGLTAVSVSCCVIALTWFSGTAGILARSLESSSLRPSPR